LIWRNTRSGSSGKVIAIIKTRESFFYKGFANFGIDSFRTFDPVGCVTPQANAPVNDLGALGYAITQRQLLQRREPPQRTGSPTDTEIFSEIKSDSYILVPHR
jgi:hypothetical protein